MTAITDEKVFPARVEMIPKISEYIISFAQGADLHPKQIIHLQVAIDEVVANICLYAYQRPPGQILIQITVGSGRLIVSFVDEGVPFDPLAADEPDINADIARRDVGGLGIFLVRRLMDEVHYKRDGPQHIVIGFVWTEINRMNSLGR